MSQTTYLRVLWKHDDPDDPVEIYSELDEHRSELRKVEVFRNGKLGYAGPDGERNSMGLSYEEIPSVETIAGDPVFEPAEITRDEFDAIWTRATQS